MLISKIPTLTAHISFLLWELIFVWPNVGRSTPIKWLFNRLLLWQPIFHSYCESSYLADQVLADIPPCWMLISQIPALTIHIPFLIWELIFGNPGVSRSTPHIKWQLQIPTLRTHIWLTKCWQIYPPSNGNFTDCCSDSSYFITTLRTHICQSRCWQIYSPHQMAFTDSYSENSYLADQVLADIPPCWMLISQIPGLTIHIPFLIWELIFGTPGVGRSSPHQMAIVDSYSESSYLADQVLADIPPCWMLISQIPALTAHMSFLLWELIFGRPGVGRSIPHQMTI